MKPRDGEVAKKDRKHPAVRMLGGLSHRSEVYAKSVPGARLTAYLVLLPWQHERKLTAVLGLLTEAPRADLWPLLREIHAEAIDELTEFALPQLEETSGVGQAIPEYDWILTADYAGVDRRRKPTSFLNRFVLFGNIPANRSLNCPPRSSPPPIPMSEREGPAPGASASSSSTSRPSSSPSCKSRRSFSRVSRVRSLAVGSAAPTIGTGIGKSASTSRSSARSSAFERTATCSS